MTSPSAQSKEPQEVEVTSVPELRSWVATWAESLPSCSVLLLCGEMGSGKTQLVQCLVEVLNTDQVSAGDSSSPTYAIHHHYSLDRVDIDHFDLYRLEDQEDLESTGFWDFFSASSAEKKKVVAIEWADRLPEDIFPPNWKVLRIDLALGANSDTRVIETRWVQDME